MDKSNQKHVSVYFPPHDRAAIVALSAKFDMNPSAFIRALVVKFAGVEFPCEHSDSESFANMKSCPQCFLKVTNRMEDLKVDVKDLFCQSENIVPKF